MNSLTQLLAAATLVQRHVTHPAQPRFALSQFLGRVQMLERTDPILNLREVSREGHAVVEIGRVIKKCLFGVGHFGRRFAQELHAVAGG